MKTPPTFGESAMAMDVVMQLTIDLLIQGNRDFGHGLSESISRLLETEGPTPGVRAALQSVLERVNQVTERASQ